jgi:hypothetical protein
MQLNDGNPAARASRPWQSRTEFLVDETLKAALAPESEIRAMRPYVGAQQLHPQRTGFLREDWTISEVMNIDRRTPNYRSWTSGFTQQRSLLAGEGGIESSTRNSMGTMWSA